jgi:hypothetical protein
MIQDLFDFREEGRRLFLYKEDRADQMILCPIGFFEAAKRACSTKGDFNMVEVATS